MKEQLERYIGDLNDETWRLLEQLLSKQTLKKEDILINEGEVCRYLWFLEKGAVKAYENCEGEYRTTHFFTDGSFITNYMSVISKQPSDIIFKAVETCELLKIPYNRLEQLYNSNHKLEHIGRVMAELQFIAEFQLRRLHLTMDALERYEYLETRQPEVFVRFALKDIASFLGITPVSLSRLRKYRFDKK
ncbi:Crp/Fnr family transcriptional regulator [Runella zeae]|uniref:Crp/Fnr family transcriptional regulator n=1 Tax=Runella zeae TaxID=94255 RepID=UPI000401CA40|nr:Crp/Fnr family transcriptional regulator [Runella zeae]